jgi:hypothetical protein
MQESTQDSITRLLRYQRAPIATTWQFRNWRHNFEILPKLQEQLEMVLEAYGKFQPIVYDTQGIRDDGVDIALRYSPEGESDEQRLIGFQAKSFNDLARPDYLKELKAQLDDAFRKVRGLSYYFIVLCTDAKAHKDKIRQIEAEFRIADRTEIIEPAFAYTFLHYPKTRIEAWIKRTFESEDVVFRRALDALALTGPSARALAIFLSVKYVRNGYQRHQWDGLARDSILRSVYEEIRNRQEELLDVANQLALERNIARTQGDDDHENYEDEELDPPQVKEFDQQLIEDVEILGNDLEVDSNSNEIVLRTQPLLPVIAVISDALARYEHNESELMSYMFSVMGVGE